MTRPLHLLMHIGRGKVTFGGLLLRISSKLINCKLTAVIRTESFNARVVLSLSTRGKFPADLKSFVFRPKCLKHSVSSVIISESHIIPTSSQAKSGGKAPNVGMDFFTDLGLSCCSLLTYSICLRVVLTESQMKEGKSLITRTPVMEPAQISARTASTGNSGMCPCDEV